jgi:uncharacterized protein (TIGR02391 family)
VGKSAMAELTAEELLMLPIDKLGLMMLQFYKTSDAGSYLNRSNIANSQSIEWITGIKNVQPSVLQAMAEAYDWLMFQGMIAVKPGGNSGWAYVTRFGDQIASSSDPQRTYQAFRQISLALHPSIDHIVRSQFLLGEYELAVFAAFKAVEVKVRTLGGFSNNLIGTKLMQEAFKTGGPLSDTSLDPGEQVSIMQLYSGALGAFKNPSSHRQVDYQDVTLASESVVVADLLLRMLDQTESRINSAPTPASAI